MSNMYFSLKNSVTSLALILSLAFLSLVAIHSFSPQLSSLVLPGAQAACNTVDSCERSQQDINEQNAATCKNISAAACEQLLKSQADGSKKVNGGINSNDALTCDNLAATSIDGQSVTPFISNNGFIKQLCDENTIPGRSAIEVVIDRLANYLVFLVVGICMIMIVLGIIQAGTSGPGGIGAAKTRILAAVTSIALLWVGRLYLSLSGITGGEFLGVNIKDGFTSATIPEIATAILTYLTYTGGALSVIFIIFGGIRMMTSTGNPQGIAQAKKIITYAIISLVAIVGVGLIFQLIQLVLTGTTNNP